MARQTTAQRVANAIAKAAREGRTITHQEARGHRPAEHKLRAANKALRAAGIEPTRAPRRSSKPAPTPTKATRPPVTNNASSGGLLGALTPQQRKAVRAYGHSQGIRAYLDEEGRSELADKFVSWATRAGYPKFEKVRAMIRKRQAGWRVERRAGDPWPKGRTGQLEEWIDEYDDAPAELFYYH